jgi:hypothetical protein
MISDKINSLIVAAMKAKDEIRLSTLRLLAAALHNEKIDKGRALSREEEIEIIQREAKMRKDAIKAYMQVEAKEQAEREKKELAILQEYLPEQLSDEELTKIVDEVIAKTGAQSLSELGKVMGKVMAKVKGKAEGGPVAEIVKRKLGK